MFIKPKKRLDNNYQYIETLSLILIFQKVMQQQFDNKQIPGQNQIRTLFLEITKIPSKLYLPHYHATIEITFDYFNLITTICLATEDCNKYIFF